MIIAAFLDMLADVIHGFFLLLPPWTLTIGTGQTSPAPTDNNVFYYGIQYIMQFDKFLPLHDGAAVWFSGLAQLLAGFFAYRVVLLIVNIIRGSGAR